MSDETVVVTARSEARIALVAFSSLGDGLIYLMMAENLRLNGYNVTYFGNIAYQIRHWLPQLNILPYPAPEHFDEAFSGYDLVIMSPPQFLRNRMDAQTTDELRKKWVLICQKTPKGWRHDHTERIRNTRDASTFTALRDLLDCSGSIRFRDFETESVVDITLHYLREKMHLRHVTQNVTVTPPAGLQHRQHRQRIVVSPDSAWPVKKNWPPQSFMRLCHALKDRGYDPKIVVAPANHDYWAKLPGNIFETPVFPGIDALAAYLYESGAVIANDSGNGHLASFLKVPVVTLYRKRNPHFHWRPAWGPAAVVCPRLTLPWFGEPIWKPFLGTRAILAALSKVL
ncbi:MAG: glycosyltransferase family 9 protein [Rhodocyclaceae bacterium]